MFLGSVLSSLFDLFKIFLTFLGGFVAHLEDALLGLPLFVEGFFGIATSSRLKSVKDAMESGSGCGCSRVGAATSSGRSQG